MSPSRIASRGGPALRGRHIDLAVSADSVDDDGEAEMAKLNGTLARGLAPPAPLVEAYCYAAWDHTVVGFYPSVAPKATLLGERSERFVFWLAVCENAAASEVAVNICLPWLLCDTRGGALRAPPDAVLNSLVLLLNLASAYMEGFAKSARLFTRPLRRSRPSHAAIFTVANGFSFGFLNVSSSFPDVAGGGSDVALATGSVLAGASYILVNMLGSIVLYRVGRIVGWRCVQRRWSAVLSFANAWSTVVRCCLLFAFALVLLSPPWLGRDVPLDLNDPEIGGVENVRLVWDEYEIHVPPAPLGLMVGILMSTIGCCLATLVCDICQEESQRPAARLVTNFISTVAVLVVQYLGTPPGFILMKFSSSFCGAFSAFSGTIGDVFDASFGSASEEDEVAEDGDPKACLPTPYRARLSGLQNFLLHLALTMAVMSLSVFVGPPEVPPIVLRPRGLHRFAQETPATPWHFESAEV